MHRLLCLRWKPADLAGKQRSDRMARDLMSEAGWSQAISWRGCRLFLHEDANDLAPILLPRQAGLVLGALFKDGRAVASADTDAETASSWCNDDFVSFTRTYWGPFLAIIADHAKDRLLVLRDPGAARPCYIAEADDAGVAVVFTHLQDLARVRPLGAIDCDFLSMFLAHPRLATSRTGLSDVREILPGQCASLGRSQEDAWTAWSPPASERINALESEAVLGARVREVVDETVAAFASLGRPIAHRLSGGLDSSVVLSALVRAGADVRCVSERPLGVEEGDESAAAAAVARSLGVAHTIIDYDGAEIDYERLLTAPTAVRPSSSLLTFADPHFVEQLDASPKVIATSGQGGDQVFSRANALAAMGEAVRDRLAGPMLLAAALDIARVTRKSVWPVFKAAIEHGMMRPPEAFARGVLNTAMRKGAPGAAAAINEALAHPWPMAARRRGPAQVARGLFLADLGYYHAPSLLNATYVNVPVLASAPIMSICSEIPAYTMMRGGRDRALVRRAYRGALPAVAVDRRRKGDTTRYFAAVATRNAAFMADILNGGELERLGLRSTTAAVSEPDISPEFIAEIWLRQIGSLRDVPLARQALPAA